MIKQFLTLEWKQFFRSAAFGKGVAMKILMAFFALYFLIAFLGLGIGGFYLIKEQYPNKDPFSIVNGFMIFVIISDLIFRYLMQKLPVMNIKPLLKLPINKSKLVHYVLTKSAISFFNVIGLFFYIPFCLVLVREGYGINGVVSWFIGMLLLILCTNYINFLINKNNKAFIVLAILLVGIIVLQYFQIYDFTKISVVVFEGLYRNSLLVIIQLILLIVFYGLNFSQLKKQLYLDDAVVVKTKQASSSDLSFINNFGDLAPFIKNDIRQIWRNKRTKNMFLMSFVFVLYGVFFFEKPIYEEKPAMLIFASLFVTGGFVINYGQFIPAWDSSHYKLLMSQNIRYRKFLESKWVLMSGMTFILYILSLPYLYYGLNTFFMITAGAIFNIGFNSLFLLWAGSFNRKPMDLTASAFGNMQATSAVQFLIIIPIMGFPMFLYWIFDKYFGYSAAMIAIATVGIICLFFKNFFMSLIEEKYVKDKYAVINAFNQKN